MTALESRNFGLRVAVAAISVLALAGTAWSQATFQPLGFPGGAASSDARAISGDGLTVVGFAGTSSGWWWRQAKGAALVPVGVYPSQGIGVSQDGSVIVYTAGFSSASTRFFPGSGATMPFPAAPGASIPQFGAVSPDGSTFGGSIFVPQHDHHVASWSQATGYIDLVPTAEDQGLVLAFSTDGSVAVGYGYGFGSAAGPPFRWTSTTGYQSLGFLSPQQFSYRAAATDVTPDGAKVVGWSDSASGRRAFVWTSVTGMVDVGAAASSFTAASAISDDGSIIIGQASGRAFIRDQSGVVRDLQTVLAAGGATGLNGWTLTTARGISSDGKTIVGSGIDPNGATQAYIAHTGSCYANCDGSSGSPVLTGNDFQCFVDRYVAGDSYADCDGVGGLTSNDFSCFIDRYGNGCAP